jgi:Tc5 transposase DNA-binding domain
MPNFWQISIDIQSTTTRSKMAGIEAALAYLDGVDNPNYLATAEMFGVVDTTLHRRHLRITRSIEEDTQERRQALNKAQEDVLLGYIDKLTDKRIPPTPQILKNLAEEIVGRRLGKNWTSDFYIRHKDRISSLYLRPLNRARIAAERHAYFQHFYALVRLIDAFLLLLLTKN